MEEKARSPVQARVSSPPASSKHPLPMLKMFHSMNVGKCGQAAGETKLGEWSNNWIQSSGGTIASTTNILTWDRSPFTQTFPGALRHGNGRTALNCPLCSRLPSFKEGSDTKVSGHSGYPSHHVSPSTPFQKEWRQFTSDYPLEWHRETALATEQGPNGAQKAFEAFDYNAQNNRVQILSRKSSSTPRETEVSSRSVHPHYSSPDPETDLP